MLYQGFYVEIKQKKFNGCFFYQMFEPHVLTSTLKESTVLISSSLQLKAKLSESYLSVKL